MENYKKIVKDCEISNPLLQQTLKSIKAEIFRQKNSQKKPSSTISPKLTGVRKSFNRKPNQYMLTTSEKEQYDYLKSASKRLKRNLEEVKNEIQKYRSEEFQNREKVLPIEQFFNECYKSVYHLIFQRQSQLDDFQLSLAYKLFRDNKMEYSDIKHRSHANTSRCENYVLRDALQKKSKDKKLVKNI